MTLLDEPKVNTRGMEYGVKQHCFTAAEYTEMARLGIFGGQRVELLAGRIFDMAPQELPHGRAVTRCFRLATRLYDDPTKFFVLSQTTLKLGEDRPEPDILVFPCSEETSAHDLPPPLWVMEISDTTYQHDAGRKLATYARHSISEYLIPDIHQRQLEVYRDPIRSTDRWTYASHQTLLENDVFSPLNGPRVEMPVKAMLP